MFTIVKTTKLGLSYYSVTYRNTVVHTCMSEAGARTWMLKQVQKFYQRRGAI